MEIKDGKLHKENNLEAFNFIIINYDSFVFAAIYFS